MGIDSIAANALQNKFGMGVYGTAALTQQLAWVLNLTGRGGRALLWMTLEFSENRNTTSCGTCAPAENDTAAMRQAYAMRLRPVIRLGQYPRTIRDFSDDAAHLKYASLAGAYRNFHGSAAPPTQRQLARSDHTQ